MFFSMLPLAQSLPRFGLWLTLCLLFLLVFIQWQDFPTGLLGAAFSVTCLLM
jgi:hypothetical protein